MATQLEQQKRPYRYRFQFGMKTFLAGVTICAVLIGLFCPRFGKPLAGCDNQGLKSVWIGPPERAEIIEQCKHLQADAEIPEPPLIITEKVVDEIDRCCFFNFRGRRYLHRVRYRCKLFLAEEFPPQSIVVAFSYDHYHLNGGGCEMQDAK